MPEDKQRYRIDIILKKSSWTAYVQSGNFGASPDVDGGGSVDF
jgi:hypothetical protein